MTDQIISLCYVSKLDERSAILNRIADWNGTAFVAYDYEVGQEFHDTARDILYINTHLDLLEVGDIGVFEWTVEQQYGKDRTKVTPSSVPWVEVLPSGIDSPEMVIQAFAHGWNISDSYRGNHDLILLLGEAGEHTPCVYLGKDDIRKTRQGYSLSAKAATLKVGILNVPADSLPCICRYAMYDERRCLVAPSRFQLTEEIPTRSQMDEVATVIGQEIRAVASEMLSRREKSLIGNAIGKLKSPSLVESVSARLSVPEDKAQELVSRYLQHIDLRLEDDKNVLPILDAMISYETPLVEQLQSQLAASFERDNEALIREAKSKLEGVNDAIRTAEHELENVRTRQKEAEQQAEGNLKRILKRQKEAEKALEEARLETADKQKLAKQVEEEIQKSITEYRENPALSLLGAPAQGTQAPQTVPALPSAFLLDLPDTPPKDASLSPAWKTIQPFWTKLCGEELASELALLSLAAYACRQELVLVGHTALTMADAIALTSTGRKPAHVREIRAHASADDLVNALSGLPVIVFEDAFGESYDVVRSAGERLRTDALVLYTVRHAESLVLEPRSLFTACFPVYADTLLQTTVLPDTALPNVRSALEQVRAKAGDADGTLTRAFFGNTFRPPFMLSSLARMEQLLASLAATLHMDVRMGKCTHVSEVLAPLLLTLGESAHALECIRASEHLMDSERSALIARLGVEDL